MAYSVSPGQRMLLSLLAADVGGHARPLENSAEVDWAEVFREASQQAVALQAINAAAPYRSHIPGDIYRRWLELAAKTVSSNLRVLCAQNELTAMLAEKGYPYAIIKGSASAAYYLHPGNRTAGDVDFLILPEYKEKISLLLKAAGYSRDPGEHICHVVFRKTGAHLEMHFEVAGIPNGQVGDIIRSFMSGALSLTQGRSVEGADFEAPTQLYHGLILLLHMQHHVLGEGIGLRHLCDWAAFVSASSGHGFWQEQLIPFLREIGLFRFACVATAACVDCFDLDVPHWFEEVSEELVDAFINEIFAGGNFGVKDKTTAKAKSLALDRGKNGGKSGLVRNLGDKLRSSVESHYPITKRVKILKPVLMAYRGALYMCRAAAGKRVGPGKIVSTAAEKKDLFQQLHLFEKEGG